MNPVRVLICDDHALVRAGIAKLLEAERGISVVGEAAGGDEAVAMTHELAPEVVLLDVVMPGRSGIAVLPDLLAAGAATRVLVLSMQDDPAYVREAFAAGANGYLLKEGADAELVQAIHEVAAGRRYVHPLLGARLAAAESAAARGARPTRSRSGSARCFASSRSATRTRRSRSSSSSRSARPRHTVRASCTSSALRAGPRSSATRSRPERSPPRRFP